MEMETGARHRAGERATIGHFMTLALSADTTGAPPKGEAWHSRSAEDALSMLGSTETGLTAVEAASRLATNGPNELREGKRISPFHILLGQFKSLIIWILI